MNLITLDNTEATFHQRLEAQDTKISGEFDFLMNQNKDLKRSLEDLKSPSLGTIKEPLVSRPELTELKRALDTHISTVVERDKAMLAEQQKHEGLFTVLRSDLNKKQTKLEEHGDLLSLLKTDANTDIQRVVEEKQKGLHQKINTDIHGVPQPMKEA
jgi:predicted nuclease with TOPRIM domain